MTRKEFGSPTQEDLPDPGRRKTLACLAAWSGAAVVWTVTGGVPRALGATNSGPLAAADAGALTVRNVPAERCSHGHAVGRRS